MKINEILSAIRSLAQSQGFYSRLYSDLLSVKQSAPDEWADIVTVLEDRNFKDTVDMGSSLKAEVGNMNEKCNRQPNGRELAEIVGFSLNTFRFDSSGFVEVMLREHRTIQQSFMREVIVPYLLGLSEVKSYDERNEASVRLATAIMARVTDDELCLPFI